LTRRFGQAMREKAKLRFTHGNQVRFLAASLGSKLDTKGITMCNPLGSLQVALVQDLDTLSWHELRELLGREQAARNEYEVHLNTLARVADSAADARLARVALGLGRVLLEGCTASDPSVR